MHNSIVLLIDLNHDSLFADFKAYYLMDDAETVEVHVLSSGGDEESRIQNAKHWTSEEIDDMLDEATLEADELHVIANGPVQQLTPLLLTLAEVTGVEIHIYDFQVDGVYKYDFENKNWRKID